MNLKVTFKTLARLSGIIIIITAFISCSDSGEDPSIEPSTTPDPTTTTTAADRTETFTFSSNGLSIKGKVFLPSEYETNQNLPAIYLIDFKEQHFQVATDEFDKVIEGVKAVRGLNALVITLAEHMDIDLVLPQDYQEYSGLFKDMVSYVDANYTSNTSRTFIGRGSESGLVLTSLFLEEGETSVFQNFIATDSPSVRYLQQQIEDGAFPTDKENKRLHYSFSTSSEYDFNIDFINTINEQEYPWLEFESVEYSSLNYENTYPTAFKDGIAFIFGD